MKSDYYRYLAEFATGKTRSKAGEDACVAYAEATKIAENDLALSSVAAQRQIPIDQTVEQIVDTPVPQVVEELVEASKVFSQDRVQQRFGEQIIETPTLSLTENVVEMPVTQTQEKMQQVANTHVQHVVNTIKVEKPKIFKPTVQKPVIQEKINQVIKPIEVPQFLNEAVDMLDAVQRQVSMVQKIQKIIETSRLQFLNKVDETPVAVQRQNHMVQTFQMPMETPQLPCIDKVVDVPVATQQVVHVPQERVVEKIVEIPQVQIVEKIDKIPEIRTDVGTQTSESFGTAPVRLGVQAEIGEVVEIRAPSSG